MSAFPGASLRFEIMQRIRSRDGWERIIARNQWFQKHALRVLRALKQPARDRPTLFAYSYAAREIFRYAKSRGWRTILGQIDPGPIEEDIVSRKQRLHSNYSTNWRPAPKYYWQSWMDECKLADCIIVNSRWSLQALQQVGIDCGRVAIIPLAYETPPAADSYVRFYPGSFSRERPLRVLFLGQIIIRKGIPAVLAAAKLLQDQPIEFWLVGTTELGDLPSLANIRWVGPVARNETARYYQEADVFLFPTISDGFGLTQLEAQAWKLPVVASQFCGEVVTNRVNGFVLPQVTGDAIASTLKECLRRPEMLAHLAQEAGRTVQKFTLATLQENLQHLNDY